MLKPGSKLALGFICLASAFVIHTTITSFYRNSLAPSTLVKEHQDSKPYPPSQAHHGSDNGHASGPAQGFEQTTDRLAADLERGKNRLREHPRPTTYFRENLRNDTFYVTAWSNAGFSNQYMNYINLIYVGILSERVAIIPPFAPADHISARGGAVPFSEVFNISYLSHNIRAPLLDWSDVKSLPARNSQTSQKVPTEHVGCWSAKQQNDYDPYASHNLLHHLGLDVSYTRVPNAVRRAPDLEVDIHLRFPDVAALIYPYDPSIPLPDPEDDENEELPLMSISALGEAGGPDTVLSCFDFMYFVTSSREEYEWKRGWSPAWRFVGKYARFTDRLVTLAMGYLGRAFETTEGDTSPFIAIHVRRGDFMYQCKGIATRECFAPVSAYARRVEEVRHQLSEQKGIDVRPSRVLLTSDEKDPAFWEEVRAQGWATLDHEKEKTLEKYGEWYSPLIDIVAHSLSTGFVGTEESTVSLVSKKRVEDWNDGVTRVVTWGYIGADDH